MKNRTELLQEKKELHEKLERENWDEILPLLKANEEQLKEVEKIELLNSVNRKYTRTREFATQAWQCEQPTEDITTSDGSFHKTKVKKYPILAGLQYAHANCEHGKLTELSINGEKFRMFSVKYEYGKENVYTRPNTFEEFLELNSIPVANITVEEYDTMAAKLNELNAKFDDAVKQYDKGRDALNISSYQYWGLVGQSNTHTYKYTPNR